MLKTKPSTARPRTLTGRSGQAAVSPIAIAVLALMAVLIGATAYLYLQLRGTRAEMTQRFQAYDEQIAQLEGNINRTSREIDTSVDKVQGLVESAGKQLEEQAKQVEGKLLGRTNTLAKELEATKQQQKAAIADVGGKITELREVATKTDTKVGSLTGRVEGVSQELNQTQEELEKAIADLKSVRGDLGVQSGLIATTSDELAALRRLGDRNYYEFDLSKTKEPQRVGRIQIRLRDTNEKKNQFNIEVYADDKRIEKKNKTLLEPIQFYVIGSRIPYEIVVNKLEKNHIVGYLATPLDENQRREANASTE